MRCSRVCLSNSEYTNLHGLESKCRQNDDEYIAERVVNNTDNGYFAWEENEFHRALRKMYVPHNEDIRLSVSFRILPQTRDGSLSSLIGTPLLRTLDPRIFATEPESLCKFKSGDSEEEARRKDEADRFEDYLINK